MRDYHYLQQHKLPRRRPGMILSTWIVLSQCIQPLQGFEGSSFHLQRFASRPRSTCLDDRFPTPIKSKYPIRHNRSSFQRRNVVRRNENHSSEPLQQQHSINNNTGSSSVVTSPQQGVEVEENPDQQVERLTQENEQLRQALAFLEAENEHLAQNGGKNIVLETFEGEGRWSPKETVQEEDQEHLTLSGEELLWCDELEENQCPIEPTISFAQALRDRAYWLVGLLVLQSLSGVILARNEALLANHPVIVYFLTMLVGAGGNAGNQASVRVIRGLALGTLNEATQNQFLTRELKMAGALATILSCAGFVRAIAFKTPFAETIAVTSALALIVFSSICLGAVLPLGLKRLGVDPAHSSTTIQVIMDILGVVLSIAVSSAILDSPLGALIISKLSFG